MRSYDTQKLSADKFSSEVSLQDSNIILNFRDDFRFLWAPVSTYLASKMIVSHLWDFPYRVKNDLTMKNVDFSKSIILSPYCNVTTGKETSY